MAKGLKAKPKQGEGLHKFIATGGKPKDYKGSKGAESSKQKGK